MRVEPASPSALAGRLVAATHPLATAAAAAGHGVRVGVDGAVRADGAALADEVAAGLRSLGLAVARVSRDGFVRPRSLRHELGAGDPDAAWERWYDDGGLRREVLDPLGPGGAMRLVQSLWDAAADRASRAPRRAAAPGTVVVVDGPFLLRRELADAFDLVAHLQTSPAAQRRRISAADERARTVPSWQRYLDEVDPATRAGLVVRYDDPAHPAVVTAGETAG